MEETISLKEIFAVLRKRLVMIIVLIVGAAVISGVISYFILTPTYQANSQFIVNQQQSSDMQQVDVNSIRSNLELINTYNVIIKSPAVLDQVADEMNLTLSAGQLSEKLQVASEENSQVVTVTATDTSPAIAADIANTTVQVFQNEIPDLMNVDNVSVLSSAVVPADPKPVNPKPLLNIAIAIVLGGMVGVGLAFLLEYMDNTVKTESDIEKKVGLPVVGVISHISAEDMAAAQLKPERKTRERGHRDGQKKKTV